MTDQQLRDELHRIADSAPSAYVPADLFARGRRARRRSLTIVAASVAAAVALIAGAVALTPTRDSAEVDPARSRADLAVPDTIYAAPSWLAETKDGRYTHIDELEQDLAIGIGAIAYVQPAADWNSGAAVVIDADDGDYHPLYLPDFIVLDPYWNNGAGDVEHQPLALSPDGQHLAWAWGEGRDAGTDGMTPGGVRVADLTTGEVVDWDLMTTGCPAEKCDDHGTYVFDLKWSEGGRQLLWTGSRMNQWDAQAYVPGARVAGVIHLASASMTPYQGRIDNQGDLSTWAVSDDGAVAFNGDPGPDLHLQDSDGEPSTLVRPELASIGEPILYRGNDLYISSEDGLVPIDGSGTTYATPTDAMWRPVGWVGDGPLLKLYGSDHIYFGQVWEVGPTPDEDSAGGSSLISLGDDAGSTVADTTSIAYGLIDAGSVKHPTAHRNKPFFLPPWVNTAAFWLVAGGLAAAIMWRRRAAARTFAVVAVVALLFGVVAGVMLIDRSAFTSGGDGQDDSVSLVKVSPTATADAPSPGRVVIPREIRWTDSPEKHVPVSDSLAVGRATLVFAADAGLMGGDGGSAVVITADGDYRHLALPDVDEANIIGGEWQAIQLSPDGARLAYVTEEGLNVVDLETGKVAEHDFDLTRGRVTSFAWSPNSGWLVWDSDYEHRAAGRVAPNGTAEPLPDDHWENAGIGNDGTVAVRTESGTRIWPDGAAGLPGTKSAVASTWVGPGENGIRSVGSRQPGEAELAIGRSPKVQGVDVDGRRLVGVAGWLSDGTPIITTGGDDGVDLRTVDPDGSTHIVAHVDSYVAGLSVATALPADLVVTPPHPTWAKPIPLWPILVIAGIVAAIGFFVWHRVRRGRRGAFSHPAQ